MYSQENVDSLKSWLDDLKRLRGKLWQADKPTSGRNHVMDIRGVAWAVFNADNTGAIEGLSPAGTRARELISAIDVVEFTDMKPAEYVSARSILDGSLSSLIGFVETTYGSAADQVQAGEDAARTARG